jgi:hypothetical protein
VADEVDEAGSCEVDDSSLDASCDAAAVGGETKPCPIDAAMDLLSCDILSDTVARDIETAVLGERIERPAGALPQTAAVSDGAVAANAAERSPSFLPLTGGGVAKLVALAAVLVIVGMVMLRGRRRV